MSQVSDFIARWRASSGSERANYQLFLSELCDLLGVERPRPAAAQVSADAYVFERGVTFDNGDGTASPGRIDLYKRGCFVLEAKQGSDAAAETEAERLGLPKEKRKAGTATRGTRAWDREMDRAKQQAFRYARALPADEGWPPFLIVADVGYCVDLFADFSRQGKVYVPFPDLPGYRIMLEDLEREDVRERLRTVWQDPMALDPSRKAAKVTRALAERLAKLAASLEAAKQDPGKVSQFLMRCLFTMFAEDIGLLPERGFTRLLQQYRDNLAYLPDALRHLWETMDAGGFSPALMTRIVQFNGSLFHGAEALPLTLAQADLLIEAARADWKDVEPAIFGTLLERALDPVERHKLGAHYTPRAYVERLVMPAIIEPLRDEWQAVQAAAVALEEQGKPDEARKQVETFHRKRLCALRVLDPACGSGNFLYVTLEHLKRLEGEVLKALAGYGGQQTLDMTGGFTVSPQQLLGLEVNPRAAAIADVVLWIGYLQWHLRTHGNVNRLDPPILKEYKNIRLQDAVLAYDERIPRLDADGNPVTRWNGRTFKPHPVTGEPVPDETARTPVYDYTNPRPAEWPQADFIIGNPPFLGKGERMRLRLGADYVEALRSAYKSRVPGSADLVMYWWDAAAEYVRSGQTERFGFITTNSIKQTFNSRIVKRHIEPQRSVSIVYAVPDHPWVDSESAAAVRIAMTVVEAGETEGQVCSVVNEQGESATPEVDFHCSRGRISPDLRIGANVQDVQALEANKDIASFGVMLAGSGFIIDEVEARELGLHHVPGADNHLRPYLNCDDLMGTTRGAYVIDLDGMESSEVRERYPAIYQHILQRVKVHRDTNRDAGFRNKWWLFGRTRPTLRAALRGLRRYIATGETSKHTLFVFLDSRVLPDHKLIGIALEDAYFLGALSCRIHVVWAVATGGRQGKGNDPVYNKTRCFDPFPFPVPTEEQKEKIRAIAEKLDAHRWERLNQHEKLTMTDMYNVLEKLRKGEALSDKDRKIHAEGLVSVLKELHDELDAAVAAAYGWPADLNDDEILHRLVALNHERAEEEARGIVRWLRPAYQNPQGVQAGLDLEEPESQKAAASREAKKTEKQAWPKGMPERVQSVQRTLAAERGPVTPTDLARRFTRAKEDQVAEVLQTLQILGLVRITPEGRYVA